MTKPNVSKLFLSFLGKLSLVTIFMVLLFVAMIFLFPEVEIPSKSVAILIVLFSVTAGVHYILLKAGEGKKENLSNFIILSSVIKLFLYAIFTFLLIFSDRAGAMANVILFFVGYIFMTVFEISSIYSQINRVRNN